MTSTEQEALVAMVAHHAALEEGVRRRVDAFVADHAGDGARAELVSYLVSEVLPHATAEQQTVYRIARTHEDLVDTLDQMIGEHERLAAATSRLAEWPGSAEARLAGSPGLATARLAGSPGSVQARLAGSPGSVQAAVEAVVEAERLAALFSSHVAEENDIVLPALVADPEVDLSSVLVDMHAAFEAARREPEGSEASADATAAVVSLLLKATTALARAGEGDEACRLAAAAWAAVRGPRPELAVRLTAALHGLARMVEVEPVRVALGSRATALTDSELDVRSFAPAQRHQLIFATYADLAPGAAFVLVNDHDPKPLGYQFEAEHAGQYTWEYLEVGPTVWRVRIGRPAAVPEASSSEGLPELDVRALPHFRRHDSIFAAFGALGPGAGFALVNDHDPKPLSYQFEAQFPGQYTWEYLEAGPTVWRVRIGRPAA